MKKILRLNSRGFGHHIILPVIVIALIALVGVRVMLASHAAAPTIAAPTNLQLNDASNNQAAITWTPSTTSGVTYDVLRNGSVVGTTDGNTPNYLDIGLSYKTTYTYTVEAVLSGSDSSPSSPLSVTTTAPATPITKCGYTITKPGSYVLAKNLAYKINSPAVADCITVSGVNDVSLNCQERTITMKGDDQDIFFSVNNVNHFLLTNCTDTDKSTGQSESTYFIGCELTGVNDATIENNVFGNSWKKYENASTNYSLGTSASPMTNIVVNDNKFTSSIYDMDNVNSSYVGHNTFTMSDPDQHDYSIQATDGNANTIYDNNITDNGNYNNGINYIGMDDGIQIGGTDPDDSTGFTTNTLIDDNTISTTFDCGIESVGILTGTTIENNNITNADENGICSYYYPSWQNNTISNNKVTIDSGASNFPDPRMIGIEYLGTAPPSGTYDYFENNTFSDNTFVPYAGYDGYGITINFTPTLYDNMQSYSINSSNSVLKNNTFTGNNLTTTSTMYPPIIAPDSMVVDGGNNICNNTQPNGQPADPPNGLVCIK